MFSCYNIEIKQAVKEKVIMKFFGEIIKNTKDEEVSFLINSRNWKQIEEFLNALWNKYSLYADRKSFINDCQSVNLHPRFWEMYLACALLQYLRQKDT